MIHRLLILSLVLVAVFFVMTPTAHAGFADSRLGLHALRLEPEGDDAEQYSDAAWGGNIETVLLPSGWSAAGIVVGVAGAQLDSQTKVFIDRRTGLRTEQQTTHTYVRIYSGGRIGPNGRGFVRPYAGASIGLQIFTIDTDVVIPDDRSRENEIRQDLESDTEIGFGYELSLGTEFNFSDAWYIDVGGKYVSAFGITQQLADETIEIDPSYIEIYAGAGVTFGFLARN